MQIYAFVHIYIFDADMISTLMMPCLSFFLFLFFLLLFFLLSFVLPALVGSETITGTSQWYSVDLGLIHLVALDLDPLLHLAAEQQAWLEQDLAAAAANRASKMRTPSYPRICSRTLRDCFVPFFKNFKKGGGAKQSISDLSVRWPAASRFLLTCALLMTSSHSEGHRAVDHRNLALSAPQCCL